MRALSRCGACLVLNRGCSPQCIFVPYFHCEDGTTRFAAIRDTFTVRNAVNILALLPVSDRFWATDTLFFEAQARFQDPVYGCVSHILTLQQQVSELHVYRAYLQDLLFTTYPAYFQPVPDWFLLQPDQNPNWSFDLPTISEDVSLPSFPNATLPPYLDEASSSQMPLPNDIDELGPVMFGIHRRH
ncbi:LOB domain-containing protein 29-like [Diospyros lotus]|uniref:LOB domain-containing protein 29-like n=1 Tax=Diospyros lotus TaxID=55363 RepID=UPI00225B4AC9|nr:LOB domain-containing protein 29-like [Diospyros lotus]